MTVAVVGAGLGGLRVCEALRQGGYTEPIVLIGAETHAPYSRPPLSKEVLRGEPPEAARLRSEDELNELGLDLRLGNAAAALDVDGRSVVMDDGSSVSFDHVVVATGATPRSLPGVALGNVFTLRTLSDCLAMRPLFVADARVVVIGAGFIGLEVAASARSMGCAVTVVDLLPTPLDRVLDSSLGDAIRSLHEAQGVDFRMGVGVESVDGAERVEQVRLGDGSVIPADVVIVGIGVRPETTWLESSGLTLNDGVVVDSSLGAADRVFAIGDLARWSHPSYPNGVRVEHWTNATEQAQHVAQCVVSGEHAPFQTVPYFWSDQYDAKLQSLGFVTKGDETRVVMGSLDEPKWVALVRAGDRLGGVIGMRSARHVMRSRPMLAAGASWDEAVANFA